MGYGKKGYKRAFSPDPEVRQRERDRVMNKYPNGELGEIPDSPSEIYAKNWKDRGDGGLVDKKKNGSLIKNGDLMGQSSPIYHNGSDAGSAAEETGGWIEGGPRKVIGKVSPEDMENLRRIDSEPIGNKNFGAIKEFEDYDFSKMSKIISESITNFLKSKM